MRTDKKRKPEIVADTKIAAFYVNADNLPGRMRIPLELLARTQIHLIPVNKSDQVIETKTQYTLQIENEGKELRILVGGTPGLMHDVYVQGRACNHYSIVTRKKKVKS